MTAETWMFVAVALCCLVAIWDPAARWQRRDAPAPGYAGLNVERVEGAAAGPVAPSTVVVCGCEVLCDREIEMSNRVALGWYLQQASRAPGARA